MDELIKRSDVLALAESGVLVSNGNYKSVVDAINGIPAVDRWIPCSERLPELNQNVIVTYNKEDEFRVDISYYDKHGFWIGDVVAWMPLPIPYKEEENE